ncbi:MAG: hypothetical protein EOP84_26015, partial [Verrucomicrobiaceae bacterium]
MQEGEDFRFVVCSELKEVHRVPWHQLIQRMTPEGLLSANFVCFTRYPAKIQDAVRFHVPITIRADNERGDYLRYFDPFALRAIELGALNVQDLTAQDTDGVVVHLTGWWEHAPGSWHFWPRLIILENASRFLDGPDLLRKGAGAVLQIDGPREALQTFLRTFYRKLLHNVPLDQCFREALNSSDGVASLSARLLLRNEGEFGLLFTLAAAELQARALQTAPNRAFLSGVGSQLESFASSEVEVPRRAKALTNSFVQSLGSAIAASLRQSDAELNQISELLFQSEERDLSRLISLMKRMQTLHQGVQQVEDVLSGWAPQDDDALQKSLSRMLTAWLHQDGARMDPRQPLLAGHSASLHVRIEPAKFTQSLAALFPDDVLRESFRAHDVLGLDVCVFHEPGSVTVERPYGGISLRQHGPSTEFQTSLRDLIGDTLRLRVCVFHRDQLLQSI